jgi:hypothetical protein
MDFRHPGHAMNLSDSTAQAAGDRRLPVVLLVHDRVLGRRLLLHVNARYLAAATLALLALTAGRLVGVSGSGVRWLVIVACVIAVYNTVIRGLARPRSDPERATEARAFLRLVLLASILFDYVALTVTVWLLGGTNSPFLAFYLFHVVISSFLLPRPAAAVSVLLAVACLAVVVFGELWGVLPAASPEALVRREGAVGWRYSAVVFAIYSSLFALTAILVISLTHLLRVAEMENQRKTRDLEELSSMRREYLLVALHDIHSPIGLVAMLLRNMLNGVCGPLGASQTSQLERAMTHLDRLETFLQELRTLSQLDTANLADRMTEGPGGVPRERGARPGAGARRGEGSASAARADRGGRAGLGRADAGAGGDRELCHQRDQVHAGGRGRGHRGPRGSGHRPSGGPRYGHRDQRRGSGQAVPGVCPRRA